MSLSPLDIPAHPSVEDAPRSAPFDQAMRRSLPRSSLLKYDIETRSQMIEAVRALDLSSIDYFSPEYTYAWHDDDISNDYYLRMRRDKEKIKEEVERALRAQNRARARKAARAMLAGPVGSHSSTSSNTLLWTPDYLLPRGDGDNRGSAVVDPTLPLTFPTEDIQPPEARIFNLKFPSIPISRARNTIAQQFIFGQFAFSPFFCSRSESLSSAVDKQE